MLKCVIVYLAVLLLAVITGSCGQCEHGHNKALSLTAKTYHTGEIFSPGYPEEYPDYADCAWKITADDGYVIHVHLDWVDMEASSQCSFDALTFYDGLSVYHPVLAKVCTEQVTDVYSSSNRMLVTFTSDFSVHSEGFRLEYSAILASLVPSTSPRTTWWFPIGDTTTRTSSTTRGSSGNDSDWDYERHTYNMAALIGGLTGGLLLLFVLCALCRYYYGRIYCHPSNRQTARPYPPTTPATAPASTIYQNSNTVFMVNAPPPYAHINSSTSTASPYNGGVANLAFSPYDEAPPAYIAVQHSTVQQPGMRMPREGVGVVQGPPPPTYTEAMRLTYPPAQAARAVTSAGTGAVVVTWASTGLGTGAGTGTGTEIGTGAETATGTGAGTGAVIGTGVGAGAGVRTGDGSGSGTGVVQHAPITDWPRS